MTDIRLPRLLDANLEERARLRPASASATINLSPLSTASMTLPDGQETVSVRDFIELYGPDGSLGIFRVAAAQTVYGSRQQLTLEHGIVTLEDDMVAEGTVLSGSMRAMLETLLSFQTRRMWALGDVEVSGELDDIEAGMAGLLEAVLTVVGSDDTAMLAFDQSVFPWVMHVRRKPSAVACECRLNRNMVGVNVRLDDAELCTRVTVEDADGAFHAYDADTIGTWGVAHKAITIEDGADAKEEGQKYLAEHKNPALSVELDALTLSSLTGEPLDRFTIGSMCRVALPERGVVMDERIMSIAYPDLFGKPDQVRLTLSSRRGDAATRLATLQSVARKNSQGVRQSLKYYHEIGDKAQIMAKEIELLGEDIKLRATKAELDMIDSRQTALYNEVSVELDAARAELRLKASQEALSEVSHTLSQAMITLSGAEADLLLLGQRTDRISGEITQAQLDLNGAKATITAQAQTLDAQGRQISAAELRMDGIAATIDLKVSRDGLISAINMSPEQIRIAAAKVVLDGYVTASVLQSTLAAFMNNVTIDTASINYATVTSAQIMTLRVGNSVASWQQLDVVTDVTLSRTFNGEQTYNFRDHDNARVTITVPRSVASVSAEVETATIYYLGR